MLIGILALQGDFAKHEAVIRRLGVNTIQVRTPNELRQCQGLIIPGGESTTLFRQVDFIQLRDPLIDFAGKKAVFGTCAGLILMANKIQFSPFSPLGLLDITIERNAFGRQIESFEAPVYLQLDDPIDFPAFFIRAPQICTWGPDVKVLGEYEGKPVLVRQGKHLGACFHPELTLNTQVHEYFLNLVSK